MVMGLQRKLWEAFDAKRHISLFVGLMLNDDGDDA